METTTMLDRQHCLGNSFGVTRPSIGLEAFSDNHRQVKSKGIMAIRQAQPCLKQRETHGRPKFMDTQTENSEQIDRKVRFAELTDYVVDVKFIRTVDQGKRPCRLPSPSL